MIIDNEEYDLMIEYLLSHNRQAKDIIRLQKAVIWCLSFTVILVGSVQWIF